MSRKNKRWYLLFRIENEQKVTVYEPLTFHELNKKLRAGWRVISLDHAEGGKYRDIS
ncbi:hypothetical protein [Desulfuribacillus stibiiarsenatis]|uniref:hypothetical protein n=1 Tax=Desulfuribacillus stibiiarsenatis TaxID=1390249 RepID=UPI0015B3C515|nr:hypothetical protein [Desulfuribacillus stibiiarsenatis]